MADVFAAGPNPIGPVHAWYIPSLTPIHVGIATTYIIQQSPVGSMTRKGKADHPLQPRNDYLPSKSEIPETLTVNTGASYDTEPGYSFLQEEWD